MPPADRPGVSHEYQPGQGHDPGHAHDHDHPQFLAHHFDTPEQQFDSGKLGIWVFLTTEILFFSGLFVAYTLYRVLHPEIFIQAHHFLDKVLGGINTVVLLFSSLTMAWAVRCAQLEKHRGTIVLILITMVCATVFIGIKAVEYSDKWDKGIVVRSMFDYQAVYAEPKTPIGQALRISDWLVYLSIPPALLLVGFAALAGIFWLTAKAQLSLFMACLAITMGGYFLGAVGGHIYVTWAAGDKGRTYAPDAVAENGTAANGQQQEGPLGAAPLDPGMDPAITPEFVDPGAAAEAEEDALHPDIGIFFSIYYCMTGLHALHIIAGIAALSWILWRSILLHWNRHYFGPVDFTGLYWHLVDLIWIYLFPLLYLIN